MAVIALATSETFDYVSDKDSAKVTTQVPVDPKNPKGPTKLETVISEGATVFTLGTLDVATLGRIYDSSMEMTQGEAGMGVKTLVNKTSLEAVRYGLKGWENFKDAKGNAIVFNTIVVVDNGKPVNVADDASLNRLGVYLIRELGDQIKTRSNISEGQAKN